MESKPFLDKNELQYKSHDRQFRNQLYNFQYSSQPRHAAYWLYNLKCF